MPCCLVLAAGGSRRSGPVPKALLPSPEGPPLVRQIVDAALGMAWTPVVLVVGAHAEAVSAAVRGSGARVAQNGRWALGRTTSVQAGLTAAGPGHAGTVVWPVDHPFIAVTTLERLGREQLGPQARDWLIPTHEGHRGHPILLGDGARDEVLRYEASEPLFRYPRSHPECVRELPVDDPGVVENLDTPEAYRSAFDRWKRVGPSSTAGAQS